MVLHLGCDEFIPLSSVVAVLDAERVPGLLSGVLQGASEDDLVRRIGSEAVRSVVITSAAGRRVFFLSPISAGTLRQRAESGFLI